MGWALESSHAVDLYSGPSRLRVRCCVPRFPNKQIGAQRFLSPRTAGYHLYKAFPKPGVTSREELAR
ncbi:MAG: hypothetical protein ACRDOL_39470 [Streptosporangiaceae bacterium]